MVQLFRPGPTRHRRHHQLSERASLQGLDQLRPRPVFSSCQCQPGLHSEGHAAVRPRRSADHAEEHRRRAHRQQYFLEILWHGFNDTGTGAPLDGLYCNICNPFEYQANYPSMIPDHMRDVTDLFSDLVNGTLPAVSYVKPDGALDGHPASSKWGLFEAFTKNTIELAQSNPKQWAETAIFVTVDEGGGYYDSGFIQPVDFFGTGPRIPIIAVSPFSRGGHISHVYAEHSSFVKFVERNWRLNTTLSGRSRDNLPNPRLKDDNPYIPSNMPAIGDLFDLFNFDQGHGSDHNHD